MDNYPQLSANEVKAIDDLYPSQTPNPSPNMRLFASVATAYGETTFIFPGTVMSTAIAKKTNAWNYW